MDRQEGGAGREAEAGDAGPEALGLAGGAGRLGIEEHVLTGPQELGGIRQPTEIAAAPERERVDPEATL